MNKNIKLITISALILALIGVEFYLLLSTKLQVGDIKTKVSEIENRIKQKEAINHKARLSKDRVDNKKNKEQKVEDKNVETDKQATSTYTSQKLESPDGKKFFLFESKNKKITDKKPSEVRFNKYYSYKNDFCIHESNCGETLVQIKPVVETKPGDKIDLSVVFKREGKIGHSPQVVGWKNNESLLVYNSFGDAVYASNNLLSLNINDLSVDYEYECKANKLSKYCKLGKYVILRRCDSFSIKECPNIKLYKIADNTDKDLGSANFLNSVVDSGKYLDEISSSKFRINLISEFNLNNLGEKFRINQDSEDQFIFDFNKEKFIKNK